MQVQQSTPTGLEPAFGPRRDGPTARPAPTEARRTIVEDARASMTRVFRTRSRGLVAEYGR